jgi:hypothetical protein
MPTKYLGEVIFEMGFGPNQGRKRGADKKKRSKILVTLSLISRFGGEKNKGIKY